MKRILQIISILLLSSCLRTETTVPLSTLQNYHVIPSSSPGVGEVVISGNINGITELIESRYFVKDDTTFEESTDLLRKQTFTDSTSYWPGNPMEDSWRIEVYRRTFDIINKLKILFSKNIFSQFSANADNDTMVLSLNGALEDISFRYDKNQLTIYCAKDFSNLTLLKELFPSATFKDLAADAPKEK